MQPLLRGRGQRAHELREPVRVVARVVGRDLGRAPQAVERRGRVEAARPLTGGPDGEGDGEEHGVGVTADERREPAGDVHVGRLDPPGGIGLGEDPGGVQREAPVPWARGDEGGEGHQRGVVGAHGVLPSSRAETASTSATGGSQEKTPLGCPPVTGVCGPAMPRT